MTSEPEYLICMVCDTPTYNFDWSEEKVSACICTTCGNDEPAEFISEAEMEEQSG